MTAPAREAGQPLVVRGLSKRFGAVEALADVSLEVGAGELFTLLGPSGCGKTTLLRTIAGFERACAGTIHLGPRALDAVPPHRRNVGLVFQSYAVFPHMTVAQNVAFGLEARGRPREEVARRVETALERVRLAGLGGRTPDQLSGGQQQRVGLARALVIEPDLLLMDEPLSNLDAKLRVAMREEIRALARSLSLTTLYVTHDQEEALAISDRIAVLDAGRVQQVGAPHEVYTRPQNAFVASFVGAVTFLEPAWVPALTGGARAAPGDGVRVAARPEDLTLAPAEQDEGGLPGTVLARTFTGPLVRYTVAAGPGEAHITVERHRPAEAAPLADGAAVRVRAEPDGLRYFDAASGARREG